MKEFSKLAKECPAKEFLPGYTCSEFEKQIRAIRLRPRALAVVAEHKIEFLIFLFAALRAGCSVALLSPRDTVEERRRKLAAVLRKPRQEDQFEGVTFWSGEADKQESALIVFTSGTEGVAKALFHPVEHFWTAARAHNKATGVGSEDVLGISLPLNHVGGLALLFRACLAKASLVLPEAPNAQGVVSMLPLVTHLSLVPTVLAQLLEDFNAFEVLSTLKMILLGGSQTPAALRERAQGLPVEYAYGMSEVCSTIALRKPLEHVTVSLIGEQSRIHLESPSLFSGFIQEGRFIARREEGFLTADRGELKENGELVVLGRIDDIIISGGENIALSEVQAVIENAPGVIEASILGFENPRWGMSPGGAMVVSESFSRAAFDAYLSQHLSRFKIPKTLLTLPELPRNEMGKVDKRALKRLLLEALPDERH